MIGVIASPIASYTVTVDACQALMQAGKGRLQPSLAEILQESKAWLEDVSVCIQWLLNQKNARDSG